MFADAGDVLVALSPSGQSENILRGGEEWKKGGMRAMAFNDPSLLTCVSNDFGYGRVFEKPIEMFADAGSTPPEPPGEF